MKEIDYYLDDGAFAPVRAHSADAGLDLRSRTDTAIKPHSGASFDTGVHVNIPEGYGGFLKAKSGLNVKHDIFGTGVIDAGYTGPIVVKLYNLGDKTYTVHRGDKIIQLVISKVETPEPVETITFNEVASNRGENGFGSSGK